MATPSCCPNFLLTGALALACVITPASLCAQTTAPGKPVPEVANADGWLPLFDGTTLSGWTTVGPNLWQVKDGVVIGTGPVSHLFSPNLYTNLEFKAEVRLNHSGNSGMYIRVARGPGFPRGYEAQVENTSPDPQRTGSLYGFSPVREQLVADDTWWTQTVVAVGNHIIIKVNDKIVTDFIDQKNTYRAGYLAFQQHNDGSVVEFRHAVAKRLPEDAAAAWAMVKKDLPDAKIPAAEATAK